MDFNREVIHTAAITLDELYPGWAEKIDLDIFDISDCTRCIAHFVLPQYAQPEAFHTLARDVGVNSGYFASCQVEWRDEIERRQRAADSDFPQRHL